ncbi:MAG: DUF512 domain-containing protein, partial [Bacteroidaceae bacterium]|nr:DUF512 domain-containing protein [Bacteroidaceae bacterium]
EIERKQVYGVTFEQGRNEVKLDDEALFENIPTESKTFTAEAKRDLIIALITLKYTQSNSVCYVKDGQAIGIGAGQQSRIHCTRLAGNKADIWWLRQHPKVMNLPFIDKIRRADRDNTIDVYISEDHEDVLAEGTWQMFFKEKPEVLTMEEKKEWIAKNTKVALGSDAFFPFGDNIERAHKSGVEFIAQAGSSVRDDHVIMTCDNVYASDEFYVKAQYPLPESEVYENYLQIENGVGLLTSLKDEFMQAKADFKKADYKKTIATGVSAAEFIRELVQSVTDNVDVVAIKNNFLGETITVAGLITAGDLIEQLKGRDLGKELLIPRVMLNHDMIFLDDKTIEDVEKELNVKVVVVENDGYDLVNKLGEVL